MAAPAGRQSCYGHPVLLAETFVNPVVFDGTLYEAGNWRYLSNTKGFARHNGRYTDLHGEPERLYIYPLRPAVVCDRSPERAWSLVVSRGPDRVQLWKSTQILLELRAWSQGLASRTYYM